MKINCLNVKANQTKDIYVLILIAHWCLSMHSVSVEDMQYGPLHGSYVGQVLSATLTGSSVTPLPAPPSASSVDPASQFTFRPRSVNHL